MTPWLPLLGGQFTEEHGLEPADLPHLTEADLIYVVHTDFNVLAVTRFSPDAYEKYLQKELPLSSMQHIKVTKT